MNSSPGTCNSTYTSYRRCKYKYVRRIITKVCLEFILSLLNSISKYLYDSLAKAKVQLKSWVYINFCLYIVNKNNWCKVLLRYMPYSFFAEVWIWINSILFFETIGELNELFEQMMRDKKLQLDYWSIRINACYIFASEI